MTLAKRRVVVTGLGAIAATGHDSASIWAALAGGVCGIRPIANIPTDRLSTRTAAEVTGFEPEAHFEPRRLAALDRNAQFALVAAREAMRGSRTRRPRTRARRRGAGRGDRPGEL